MTESGRITEKDPDEKCRNKTPYFVIGFERSRDCLQRSLAKSNLGQRDGSGVLRRGQLWWSETFL